MKAFLRILLVLVILGGLGAGYYFLSRKDLSGRIVMPYIAHQKPRIDPHVPSSVPIADKLDEVLFDGLFNVAASPSGVIYEDGLGEFVGIDRKNVVTVRLKPNRKWHSSWAASMVEDRLDQLSITPRQEVLLQARDLQFTLKRIEKLGSMSPDHILVGQAIPDFAFAGPDQNGDVQFRFKGDRIWTEPDIKEVLSFKVLPYNSEMAAATYTDGTGPYMAVGEFEDELLYHKVPEGAAQVSTIILQPFIDNSTYATELRNSNINTLLSTPFGAVSPILRDTNTYFHKSSIATTFFALFYNCGKLDRAQRQALRALVNNRTVMNRFFKVNTAQQRHIANYRGEDNNYEEHLNNSVFPTTSYYVEEQIVVAPEPLGTPDLSVLPDTVRIQTCLNYEYREELAELVDILNDPTLFQGKLKATAVSNEEIAQGNYHAVLVPISGYRSNFLFDLYNIFLREPDFAAYRINLRTTVDRKGNTTIDPSSFSASKNFFRIDLANAGEEQAELAKLLEYVYGFMSTREIGDKQAYAQFIDQLEQDLHLGSWLFSLPSLAYFDRMFDQKSIDMYGTASQLSTIEKWRESPVEGWKKYLRRPF
jgi:hypothetical protein